MSSIISKKQFSFDSDELYLRRFLGELIDNRKFIIIITVFFISIAIIYALFVTPIYQADALIQIEQNQGNTILNNMSHILPDAQPRSAPEAALLVSRMIIGQTVDDLNLQTLVEQEYFPIFGHGWARIIGKKPGNISVKRLDFPFQNKDTLKMSLTVLDKEHYQLSGNGTNRVGLIGNLLEDKGIIILVDKIDAIKGTKFKIQYQSRLKAINKLKKSFSVSDIGKDTGILNLKLTGESPTLIARILDRISQNYLEQNIARQAAKDAKSLVFLKYQLPKTRKKLDEAEDKLNDYRTKNDSVDLSLEAKSVLDQIINIDNQLNKLTFREAEIAQFHTKAHPTYKTLLEKRQTLLEEKNKLNRRISRMPATQQKILRLSRDVESNREVYMQLLLRKQELSIAKSSAIGNVRIIDHAITQSIPIKPQKALIVASGMILGIAFSIAMVLGRILLRRGVESFEQIETLGIDVYSCIPFSKWLSTLNNKAKNKMKESKQPLSLLAIENPADLAIEAIRSLRTSLHFEFLEAKNNILMITGATPNVGKTFISTNLATVLNQSGKKVLLIDADMRKGYAHKLFNTSNQVGLATILSAKASVEDAIKTINESGFDFIPNGISASNSTDLLMNQNFELLLKWASKNYDLVIIDTPPILSVSDAAVIGRYVGVTMLVVRFEINTVKEIEMSIKRFKQNGVPLTGLVLNCVIKKASTYLSYGYDYYGYSYSDSHSI